MTAAIAAIERKERSARRGWVLLGLFAAATALWLLGLSRLYVNASWSDAAWGYFLLPLFSGPQSGEAVLFVPPETLDAPVPYLKSVLGMPGATVTVDPDLTVRVDGKPAGTAKTHARDGRPLDPIPPGVIPPDHYFLYADHPDSHDSRYAEIGLVPQDRLLGRAVALPDFPWLGLNGPLVGPDTVLPNPNPNPNLSPGAETETGLAPDPFSATLPEPKP